MLIELKSAREKNRLVEQVDSYSKIIDTHADLFGELYGALLGIPVSFAGPCEKWIVWPAAGLGPDKHEEDLAALGIRLVCYEQDGAAFTFHVGRAARGMSAP